MGINDHVLRCDVFGTPLVGARRALDQFPLVLEQHLEIAHVPGRRARLPGAFDAAGGGVATLAAAVLVDPTKAHGFHRRGFRLRANQLRVTCSVRLAEGVAARDQRHRFVVVHRHAGEGLAHVAAGCDRVGIAVRSFRVHVDQAHLHGGERVLQLAITAVAAVRLVAGGEPLLLGAPVNVFFRRPDVGTAAAKAEGLEAHRLHRHVAGEDEQVSPGNGVAVLLLDRPQQAACLVEVAVVGPAVERRETLVTGVGAAAAVGRTVGARCVPGHADKQAAIVAVVSRPPVLRVSHQCGEIALQRGKVELFERLGVVEVGIHRVRHRLTLVQDGQVQLIGPPVGVGLGALRGTGATGGVEGAFAFGRHSVLLGLIIE